MQTRFARITLLAALFCALNRPALAQHSTPQENTASIQRLETRKEGIIQRIEFTGLRRIAADTLRTKIKTRIGEPLETQRLEEDVRTLERLGWFESVIVQLEELPMVLAANLPFNNSGGAADATVESIAGQVPALRLTFVMQERAFLAKVEFKGSRLLTRERIDVLLAERGIRFKMAAPCDRSELWRAKRALLEELAELGHPRAEARIKLVEVPTAAVQAKLEISDGPRMEVERVAFTGNSTVAESVLQRQLKNVAPDALFADWRGKTIYTPSRLSEDAKRVEAFYRNHGHLEARVGQPKVEVIEHEVRQVFPWPRRTTRPFYRITLPVEEGPAYRLTGAEITNAEDVPQQEVRDILQVLKRGEVVSQGKVEHAAAVMAEKAREKSSGLRPNVEVKYVLNREAQTARVEFEVRESPRYTVRRIEFRGHHQFSDRYYRRRLPLKEGDLFDADQLDRGLAVLSRAGFIKPIRQKDVHVTFDGEKKAADISIHVEELGRQRIAFSGTPTGMRSTVGLAYTVFNLLGGEEFLAARLDLGPEQLSVLLGVAKEGVFGTPATLSLNLFSNVFRPWLQETNGRQRLFTSHTSGAGLTWDHPTSLRDSIAVSYELSHSTTRIRLPQPIVLPGLSLGELRTGSSRSAFGLGWRRELSREQASVNTSLAGGWLGGAEKTFRTSFAYTRVLADPATTGRNVWSVGGNVAGVSSYWGAFLPLNARFYPGEEHVRGFRAAEMTPYVLERVETAGNTEQFRAESQGANLITAFHVEYCVPLERRTEVVGFFDAGTNWLLPRWAGTPRPQVLSGTNGVMRASTGIELRFQLPVVEQKVRVYYTVNPLRLASALLLPDGTRFLPRDRAGAFGWALGTMF